MFLVWLEIHWEKVNKRLLYIFLWCSSDKLDKKQQQTSISKPKHSDPIPIKEKFIQGKVLQD